LVITRGGGEDGEHLAAPVCCTHQAVWRLDHLRLLLRH
jgi:hypothetical protein